MDWELNPAKEAEPQSDDDIIDDNSFGLVRSFSSNILFRFEKKNHNNANHTKDFHMEMPES